MRKRSNMLIPTILMGLLAAILLAIGYVRGGGEHVQGARIALVMTLEILPLLVFAFLIAGMVQVLLSPEIIARWVGAESGLRGILLGSIAGGLCPGGPFVSLPIAAGMIRAGASPSTMVAFITGWSIYAISRLPMEVGILGWKFTALRLATTAVFPPLAGFLVYAFSGGPK